MTDPKQTIVERARAMASKIAGEVAPAPVVEKTAAATTLWKYTDEDGKDFYLPEKKTGTIKSPYSGKSFTAKPERASLSDVGKELKEDAKAKKSSHKIATSQVQWELAADIIDKGEKHPALQAVHDQWENVLKGVDAAKKSSAAMKRVGAGRTEDPTFVLKEVVPALEELSDTAGIVAKQLMSKLG